MRMYKFTFGVFLILLFGQNIAVADIEEIEVPVNEQELYVTRYPASGEQLIIWIAPGYGSHQRVNKISEKLVERGIEVWHVDLAESLFLPKNTTTMRSLDGSNVASLIEAAYAKTGKKITLLTRSYGALPLLRGARVWQQRHENDNSNYLKGAILFSPELYSTVPALGLPPVYSDITYSTNIPIMIYQAGKRSNRWQLGGLLKNLRTGGAELFLRLKKGVIGLFYLGDITDSTQAILKTIPAEIEMDLKLLNLLSLPKQVEKIYHPTNKTNQGLDNSLKKFKADPEPLALNLMTAEGKPFKRDNYKGKVTIVNFWATWCPPCVEEIPSLNNLRKQMQGTPFELISVNYAENKKVVKQFLERVNVDFPVLLDETGRVSADWRVLVYPSTFVISPTGKIEYGVNGAILWDSPEVVDELRSLLK